MLTMNIQRNTKFFILISIVLTILISGCSLFHRTPKVPKDAVWNKYTYYEYDGFLYTTWEKGMMYGIICANVAGIQGSFILTHKATEEQFYKVHENLLRLELDFIEETKVVDKTDYPDLSMYLSFIMSHDELYELWGELGLEEKLTDSE